jgi:hypothetical protein
LTIEVFDSRDNFSSANFIFWMGEPIDITTSSTTTTTTNSTSTTTDGESDDGGLPFTALPVIAFVLIAIPVIKRRAFKVNG